MASVSEAPLSRRIVVAIDGPAASGKSSTARWVAERLHFRHIDSGALYRAATALALRHSRSPDTWTEADVLAAGEGITLAPSGVSFTPTFRGELLDEAIRGAAVTQHVSRVARMPRVRDWVNAQARAAAVGENVVVDGRDIGTAVFPDAQVKIFLVADSWERARRRLRQRFGHAATDEQIAEETERLVQRDARDATQTVQANDAILIDTTYLTQVEQVERIVALVRVVTQRGDDTSDH